MAQTSKAPKQWCLTKTESISSFENWKNNLEYVLSLDCNFAPFLIEGVTWLKYTKAAPLRGFCDDTDEVEASVRKTAQQKVNILKLMLGQVANYCPVISRNTIIQKSTSMESIWQQIRTHFGFQSTGGHFLDLTTIVLQPEEKPEDLFQRLTSFMEDNLLTSGGGISHHGEAITEDEEITPTVENLTVLLWLQLLDKDLPRLIKQRYCTELRSRTLASIKPEISQALDSLLEELHTINDIKVMRSSTFANMKPKPARKHTRLNGRFCALCDAAKRKFTNHYLSKCPFLPKSDREFFTNMRSIVLDDRDDLLDANILTPAESGISEPVTTNLDVARVSFNRSPFMHLYYKQVALCITLDTGAEASLIKESVAKSMGVEISPTSHSALQADGQTQLPALGEIKITLHRDNRKFFLDALIVKNLGTDILAGVPFLIHNDITLRPSTKEICLSNGITYSYAGIDAGRSPHILRATTSQTIWPGEYVEACLPNTIPSDSAIALEPRNGTRSLTSEALNWPKPNIITAVGNKIRIFNDTPFPQHLGKHDQYGQIMPVTFPHPFHEPNQPLLPQSKSFSTKLSVLKMIKVDPDRVLCPSDRQKFIDVTAKHANAFDQSIGRYNGAYGPFEATVNMGPTQPPQRKGRVPQYSTNRLVELQQKIDELESEGVLCKPEDVGVTIEYVSPTFLVKKPGGGTRLVTAFADVAKYSKPHPSLMPDVNSILRKIGGWRYIIVTDLSSAYYQIPLSKSSMKYCGIVTPFRGTRVYTRCAMGMPGSETALEELMCRILGGFVQEGCAAKLADDLYCGGSTPEEALANWERILKSILKAGLHLSAHKTVICPKTTMLLGWIWCQGTLQASPHRISTLSTCELPKTVRALRSFIGAYKVLSRVIPDCSSVLSPLDDIVAGKESKIPITWTEPQIDAFRVAQKHMSLNKIIKLPQPEDQLWIVTDGSTKAHALGATLYVVRNNKTHLAGFFSAKLRQRQNSWIPCEIEALSIAAAVKHFGPYIIQSQLPVGILTDSKPCVQAVDKLRRGEFSTSPRIYSFLAAVSQYQCFLKHLGGNANIPSDFSSRNARACTTPSCQICRFIHEALEEPIIRSLNVKDVLGGQVKLPYTNRTPWHLLQSECPDLRRTHAHLTQGTRPSKKSTNIKAIKRYLQKVTIAADGLLVVRSHVPFAICKERIVIPQKILPGILTALHFKLNHPSCHQLKRAIERYFFALDMDEAIRLTTDSCHHCLSLKQIPHTLCPQNSSDPPTSIGERFAADVLRREKQFILLVREVVTSYTQAMLIEDEKRDTVRNGILQLCLGLRPLDGPNAVVRTDAASCFTALKSDPTLDRYRISIEVGNPKNINKNPIAERAIQELSNELLHQQPLRGPVSSLTLCFAIDSLNTRIRSYGISAREALIQRDQFTNQPLALNDNAMIRDQYRRRLQNHPHSEKCKATSKRQHPQQTISVGDIVYLYKDRKKHQCRDRYIVTTIEGEWCNIMKFAGSRLLNFSHRIRLDACYKVPSQMPDLAFHRRHDSQSSDDDQDAILSSGQHHSNPACHPQRETPRQAEPPDVLTEPAEMIPDALPSADGEFSHPRRSSRQRKLPSRLQDYVMLTSESSDEEI